MNGEVAAVIVWVAPLWWNSTTTRAAPRTRIWSPAASAISGFAGLQSLSPVAFTRTSPGPGR
ncbi:MAG: hypothetical protein HYS77_17905 [Candidatus Rokubacteria bacterium]|nr:hypothetical protein [Candidatus Rokubacteria bacterium]